MSNVPRTSTRQTLRNLGLGFVAGAVLLGIVWALLRLVGVGSDTALTVALVVVVAASCAVTLWSGVHASRRITS